MLAKRTSPKPGCRLHDNGTIYTTKNISNLSEYKDSQQEYNLIDKQRSGNIRIDITSN